MVDGYSSGYMLGQDEHEGGEAVLVGRQQTNADKKHWGQ